MRKLWIRSVLLVGFLPLLWGASEPQGGVEAQVRQAELNRLMSWWKPSDDSQGRWWWDRDRGGSAWVRWGGFQVGPLTASSGSEGVKTWGPGLSAPVGTWGAEWEGSQGSLWLVQSPQQLEGGAQAWLRLSEWSGAAGVDRKWVLSLVEPGESRWLDEARAGLEWAPKGWSWGAEGEGTREETGRLAGMGRFRGSWEQKPWRADARTSWSSDGTRTLRLKAEGRVSPVAGMVQWDSQQGSLGRLWWDFPLESMEGRVKAEARYHKHWTGEGTLGLERTWSPGRWSVSWTLGPGDSAPVQTIQAGWKEASFEVEIRWATEGLKLGWLGPHSEFDLTWRWLY